MEKTTTKEHAIKTLRRAGVPLALIETSDAQLTINSALKALNGKTEGMRLMHWDIIQGLTGLNDLGITHAADIGEPIMTGNPTECLNLLGQKVPENGLVFFANAHNYLSEPTVKQAIWNLRDKFKSSGSLLLMLAPAIQLPEELKHDVVVINEPLPDAEAISGIVTRTLTDAGLPVLTEETTPKESKVVSSLLGLNGFAAEQTLAMSLSKSGINIQSVLERRRSFISAQSGMEIRTDKITFNDIAGYENIKKSLSRKIAGKRPPGLILWCDEAEKAFAGSTSDSSGTTQDQVATLLTYLQDRLNEDRLSALMAVGYPGTGKSAIAMALRNEAQCECIRLDMGAMKGSLVGESEKKIRQVLKTIDALCSGHILMISTCNSVQGLPSPFISRHAFGTYFFDLPTAAENAALWKLKKAKYELPADEEVPASQGWTGREIQQCAFLASDMGIPLVEASSYIAPFCRSGSTEVDSLRKQALGRWISASVPGMYTGPAESKGGRKMTME